MITLPIKKSPRTLHLTCRGPASQVIPFGLQVLLSLLAVIHSFICFSPNPKANPSVPICLPTCPFIHPHVLSLHPPAHPSEMVLLLTQPGPVPGCGGKEASLIPSLP